MWNWLSDLFKAFVYIESSHKFDIYFSKVLFSFTRAQYELSFHKSTIYKVWYLILFVFFNNEAVLLLALFLRRSVHPSLTLIIWSSASVKMFSTGKYFFSVCSFVSMSVSLYNGMYQCLSLLLSVFLSLLYGQLVLFYWKKIFFTSYSYWRVGSWLACFKIHLFHCV